jgi:hypothetical protein
MSYAQLGTFCYPQGNAITSNHKYISPFSDVYQKYFTQMRKYPGTSGVYPATIPSDINAHHPEHLKAYYSKDSSPRDILAAPYESNVQSNSCATCSSGKNN